MILYNDATSPFGRKVIAAAIERGIPLTEHLVDLATGDILDAHNPLRQIPTLVDDEAGALYDSDVILQFLDDRHRGEPLLPPPRRHEVLRRTALANGLMEATLTRLLETRRPAGQVSGEVVAKLESRIARCVAALEREADSLSIGLLAADEISVGCALGYLDFRYSPAWRNAAARLTAWYAAIETRPSFVATAPTRSAPAASPLP